MNIKKILKELVTYYEYTRQAGHTTAVIEGVRYKPKTIVVTNSKEMSNHYKEVCSDELHTITLNYIGSSLRGHNRPIVFDNAALHVIFSEALKIIESIEIKNNSNIEDDILNKDTKYDPRGYVWRYVVFDEIIQEGDQMYVDWDKFDVKSEWIECFNYVGKEPYMYPNILFRTKRPLS